MTLETDAYQKRAEELNLRTDRALGLAGEHWRYVVTSYGREVYRSRDVPNLDFLRDPINLPPPYTGRYSLWLIGSSFRFGLVTRSAWQRMRFSILKRNTWILIPALAGPALPTAVKNIRNRLYPPGNRSRKVRVLPTRSSRLRPNPETVTLQRIACRNRAGVFLSLTKTPYTSYSRSWSGVRTPGYGKKKRRALPVNNHSVLTWKLNSDPTQLRSQVHVSDLGDNNWWLEFFNELGGGLALPGSISHIETARFRAIRKIIERTENGIEGNLAQDVTQIGQMFDLMNDTVQRILKANRLSRSGNLNGALNVLVSGKPTRKEFFPPALSKQVSKSGLNSLAGSVSNNWLALQYGWKPLLQDLDGAMRSLANFQNANYCVRQVKGKGMSEDITSSPVSWEGVVSGSLHSHVVSTCRIGLRYSLDNRLTSFLAQTGFTNPINLFWEVLPYSFVVDWFLPIGPYLETLSAWDGLVFIDGWQTQFTRKILSGVNRKQWKVGNYMRSVDGVYSAEGIKLDRIKLTAFPSAVFPQFKNPFSVDHVLNGIALLHTSFDAGLRRSYFR